MMSESIRILVVGVGRMGRSHLRAYLKLEGFEVVGLCKRSWENVEALPGEVKEVPRFEYYEEALEKLKPDAVSINTFSDTHADYSLQAIEAGAHVFVEKPLAETVKDARSVVERAKSAGRKLVVGYILRHHPSWNKLVELARGLGKPLVMRMNLNQQSSGEAWRWHRNLMETLSPIVDCGVHYVDIMCLITGAKPTRVHGVGARLSDEISPEMYNFGHFNVAFDDGSVGWYEAGWGPMISEEAFFIKDIMGPEGCVSISLKPGGEQGMSADIETHTKTSSIRYHRSAMDPQGNLSHQDEWLDMEEEPGHDELCEREQSYFRDAIRNDADLSAHMDDAVNSLRIVLAADESVRTGRVVEL